MTKTRRRRLHHRRRSATSPIPQLRSAPRSGSGSGARTTCTRSGGARRTRPAHKPGRPRNRGSSAARYDALHCAEHVMCVFPSTRCIHMVPAVAARDTTSARDRRQLWPQRATHCLAQVRSRVRHRHVVFPVALRHGSACILDPACCVFKSHARRKFWWCILRNRIQLTSPYLCTPPSAARADAQQLVEPPRPGSLISP